MHSPFQRCSKVTVTYDKSLVDFYLFSSKTSEASSNLVLYVRLPGEENSDCYYPLFLKEKSYAALKCELAQKLNIDINSIDKILNKRKTTFQSGK